MEEAVSPAEEAAVLMPEQHVDAGGETLTVRELSFAEGLRLGPMLRPLIEALDVVLADTAARPEAILAAFEDQAEVVMAAVATVTGKGREWLDGLEDADGQALLLAFWQANMGFFVRRLAMRRVRRPSTPPAPAISSPD